MTDTDNENKVDTSLLARKLAKTYVTILREEGHEAAEKEIRVLRRLYKVSVEDIKPYLQSYMDKAEINVSKE